MWMNKTCLRVAALVIGCVAPGVYADDMEAVAKRIPRFLEAGSACVTKISYPGYEKAMKNNPLFKSGEIVLPDRVVERKIQVSGGEAVGAYQFSSGNRQVDFFSGAINVVVSDEIGEAATVGLVSFAQANLWETHFSELAWVRPEHFQGLVSLDRNTFYLFADDGRELYISPETNRPFRFQTPSQVYEYSIQPMGSNRLDVASEIRSQFEQFRRSLNQKLTE